MSSGPQFLTAKTHTPNPNTKEGIPLKCIKILVFCKKKGLIHTKSWTRDGQRQNL